VSGLNIGYMEKLAVLANITNICEMLQGGEIDTVGC